MASSDRAPRWLQVMRAITGTEEAPGDEDNPKILAMADIIAQAYLEMADYCAQYTHDEIAWCGLTVAFCMTMAGIRPVFGPTDTDKFLWALAWSTWHEFGIELDEPVLGCVVVREREGGGHVALFERQEGDNYILRGGNQSDAVNEKSFPIDGTVALIWPRWAGLPPKPKPIPVEDRPLLEQGESGKDVEDLQKLLPRFEGEIDGDFGPITEDAVLDYQRSRGLEVDGIVGQETWTALYEHKPPLPPPPPPPGALSYADQQVIMGLARNSRIADYEWRDRGQAPIGYTQGMALAFAQTYRKLKANHAAAIEMAKANTHNEDKDALAWFNDEFRALGMSNETSGPDTLRHLYVLLMGLGMRESSGQHCEGRDMSADNVQSDTAEAGLFQTSYDAHDCDPTFDQLFDEYSDPVNEPTCYYNAFAEDVECSDDDWENYGSGDGYEFQRLCKECPAFAVETCGVTLRNLRQHYGPINRKEVELRDEADLMFRAVQDYIEEAETGA